MESAQELLTSSQAAARLGVSTARVRHLCGRGRLAGAAMHGRDWMIPAAAVASFTRRKSGRPRASQAKSSS